MGEERGSREGVGVPERGGGPGGRVGIPGKGWGSRERSPRGGSGGGAGLTEGAVGALVARRAGAGVAADAVLAGPVVEARLGGTRGATCGEDPPRG